jgi:hypothetical protein
MRYFTTALLIATVLTCPYGCLGGMDCAGPGESAAPVCCGSCCHEPSPVSNDESVPDRDTRDSCLCEGALIETGVVELVPQPEEQTGGMIVATAVSDTGTSTVLYRPEHDRSHIPGSSLRIALQSFLC